MISIDDFKKIDLRVGKILAAERVEGSDKLIKLQVDLGEDPSTGSGLGKRQILAGVGTIYEPATLVDKEVIIVANLEPRKMMGLESNGMLLAASDELGPVLIMPESEVKPGTGIR